MSHVFEPFFTTKGVGKGTGLGLATCYGIVKDNGGYILIRSAPGKGTTFEIYLPRVRAGIDQGAEGGESEGLQGGTETVLLAEDEPSVRGLMAHVLRGHGYTVLEAANGEEALAMARGDAAQIDLLLCDVVMPWMGGKELAVAFQDSFPAVRILFTTGYTDDSSIRHRAAEAGGRTLQKPFTAKELARTVRQALDAPLPERR
jgi:CheY-like chemotaxis protein